MESKDIVEKIADSIMETYKRCPILEVRGRSYKCVDCKNNWEKEQRGCKPFYNALVNKLFIKFYNRIKRRNNMDYRVKGIYFTQVPRPLDKGFKLIINRKYGALHCFLRYTGNKHFRYRPTNKFINIVRGDENLKEVMKNV